MRITSTLLLLVLAYVSRLVIASYEDITDCAIPCSADVSGTNCTKSSWPCLCANGGWVDKLNACVQNSCSPTEQNETYFAFAQICAIFDVTLTASPEATFPASVLSDNISSSLSAIGGPGPVSVTSLPSATSGGSTMETSTTAAMPAGSTTPAPASSATTRPAAETTTPGGSGNAGSSTRETDVWLAFAALVLGGAAIL